MNKMLWGGGGDPGDGQGWPHSAACALLASIQHLSLLRHLGETNRGRPASQFWVPLCLPSSKASGPQIGPQTYLKGRQTQILRLSAATELRESWPGASTRYPDPRQGSGRMILFLGWGGARERGEVGGFPLLTEFPEPRGTSATASGSP